MLLGKFTFKKLPNGKFDKTKVVCTLCNAELVYCRSSSSLKYHLNAKHITRYTQVHLIEHDLFSSPIIIVEQLSQAVCDAFWKQEMSPWSNAPPGLKPVRTHILNAFGRIQMSHFNLD